MAIRRIARLIALACLLGGVLCPALRAQTNGSSTHDGNQPNMSGVTDVTGGMKYLLRDDDLTMLQVSEKNGTIATSVVDYHTDNSRLNGSSTTTLPIPLPPGPSTEPGRAGIRSGRQDVRRQARHYRAAECRESDTG